MSAERVEFEDDDDVDELIYLLDQYKAAVAHLISQPRHTPEYHAARRTEEELSRRIHLVAAGQRQHFRY